MWLFWTVLVVIILIGVSLLLRRVVAAFISAPCEEEGCDGNMHVKDVPYGPNGRITQCLVCDTCGVAVPLVRPPLGP